MTSIPSQLPAGSRGRVFDDYARPGQLIANRVGGGVIFALARGSALFQRERHQSVDNRAQVAPRNVAGASTDIESKHAQHRRDLTELLTDEQQIAARHRSVAFAYRVV